MKNDQLRYRESAEAPLQLDVAAILRQRAPRLPGFVSQLLARIIRQNDLNALLRAAWPAAGSDFSRRILTELNITAELHGKDHIEGRERLVFASNHPLGGLDGITLIALLGGLYGDENIIFPVNDMLMNVRPLQSVFTPINKYGRQGRERANSLRQAFESNKHVIIFPAGLVSRLQPGGTIQDLEWRKTFVSLAAETGRQIVPVHFEALNRKRFYRLAQWRKRLHIPFNLEQVFLPAELVACRNRRFSVHCLPLADPALLLQKSTPRRVAADLRAECV